jgi:hypothetical protein
MKLNNISNAMTQHYSNFVTPPDFVDDNFPSVLIIDADWNDIDTLALWCKTAPLNLNVYIYSDIMLDEIWLAQAINSVDTIILNTANSAVDHIKKQLLKAPNVYYYGNKSFLANKQKIESPMDFFIKNYG